MKKTKLLTSLAALALVVSLGACEVNVEVGDVDVGVDVNPNDSSEPDEGGTTDTDTNPGTGEGGEGGDTDTDSGSGEGGGESITYTYSLEVENGDSLTLTYDGALESQTGVELSIKLVTTPSTGAPEKVDASADNLTFTVSDPTIVTVSGLTVLPLSGGETSITIKWSEHDEATASVGVTVTDVTVYGPTSWADYITNEYDLGVIAGAFGDVSLDDILPFSYELLTNSSYSFQSYYVSAESFRLMYSWPSDSNGLTNAWDTLLTDFGYVKVSSETSGLYTTVTYTLEGGYTVEIKYSTVGDWDLYLYPPEPEPEPATSWSDYITNDYDRGQIASLFGSVEALDEFLPFYGDTDPDSIVVGTHYSKGQRLAITYNSGSSLLSTWVSLLTNDGWTETDHTSSWNETYTFEKDGYTVELETEYSALYVYVYPKAEEPEPASTWNEYITNENYRAAVSGLFGSVEALDEFLPFYGDSEPTSIVTGTHYSKGSRLVITYSSDVLSAWVSLFEADGWTQTDHAVSYNETYTFEKDGYTVDLELEWGTTYVYVYPKAETGEESGEDLETAQAILNAVQGATPNWTAFYGNAEDTYGGELTSYLALDANGALYGYIDSDDWDDETYTYYFYNGYRCMYNVYNVAQEPKEITTTFEEELELYIAGLSVSFNLATDSYELGEVNDGYSLVVTHNYIEYTFIVDASYNLLSLEREQLLGSSSDYVDWSYVEGLDFEDVEYALSETDFDPDDFFGEQGGDEETGEEPSGLTLADYIAALNDKGFNYGDGFYFSQQSLEMDSDVEVVEAYDSLEIEALSNDVGYASQGHYDVTSGYYASEFYSDGTTTYVYDSDDQQAADAGGLYGYWFYQYTLESYFEFDTITGQLNSLGEDADLTDSDNAITDSYLYLYAYSSDYSAMVELFATYDENGITYLVYSYGTNTSSYAVVFYPTESVTTPEWYVPDTGAGEENPLAAVVGSYTGTSNAGASLTLELYEDGTGLYDGNTAITWTFDGTNVYFEINYGDPVNLVWDAEAQTLTGTWLQDYEYDIYLSFTKVESGDGDT